MSTPNWPKLASLPLDPTVEEWQRLTTEVTQILSEFLQGLGTHPVAQAIDGEQTDPTSLAGLLADLWQGGFDPAHPGFMAYIPGGGLVSSALAEWIIKTTNRYGTAHFASPRLAELENRVIQTFVAWVGFPNESAGVLTTGGSLANFTAVVTARRAKLPEDFLSGVLYCSDQTHHSVMKAANLTGFSSRNIRSLPSDRNFRLVPEALLDQVRLDRSNGLQPFLVVASAGTTNTGSIDPLESIAAICAAEDLWFHVDAAYGGAFVITEEGKRKLKGMEQASSITLDPHKGLFLPYGTGCILVRDRNALIEAHEMRGDYMPDLNRDQAHLDPFSLSVELSREHRGLKVALPLMLHGVTAFEDALNEKLSLTRNLYQALHQIPELEVLNEPELTTIAFRKRAPKLRSDEVNRNLLDAINAGGRVFLSGTVLGELFAIRVSILSHRTHDLQIRQLVEEIHRAILAQ